jgi:SAM-dependent methyltransferase
MDHVRKPYEGVWNIVRFNYHFYLLAVGAVLLLKLLASYGPQLLQQYAEVVLVMIGATTLVSLLVSYYVYDASALYTLDWLPPGLATTGETIVNIHAGFDETSMLLRHKYAGAELLVFDFYDPQKHTEVSIKRARQAYAPFPGTQRVQTQQLPAANASAKCVFLMLAAHEVRDPQELIDFLQEVRRILHPDGKVIVVEHLRDAANFMAYTVGFLHFYSRSAWLQAFEAAGLTLVQEKKVIPFVSAFILGPGGSTS